MSTKSTITKAAKTEIAIHVSIAERALSDALRLLKAQPRAGKDLEQLKLIESAAQAIEGWRLAGGAR